MRIIKQEISDKINYYLFIVLAFALPIHGRLVPPVIVLIMLSWLLEFNFSEKITRIKKLAYRKNILAFSLLYLLYVIGVLYSSQMKGQEGALFDLEVKLSLLIFPLLFATIDFSGFKSNFFIKVQKAFIIGSLVSSVLLLNSAFFGLFRNNDISIFYYTGLSKHFHPSYLAMYFTLDIAIIISWLINSKIKIQLKRIFAFVLILYFQVFIILLSSKAGILCVGVTYILMALYFVSKRILRKPSYIFIPLLLLISFFLTLLMFPRSYSRFVTVKSSVKEMESISPDTRESSAARILVWGSAFEVIKANPVFGVGTGDVKQELRKVYKEKNIESAYEDHLNAHNQYLQTTIAIGIIGLLVLLLYFIIPFVFAFKNNNLLYMVFLVITAFNFLFESMLERQAGVVFYAFFNVLLFINTRKKEE